MVRRADLAYTPLWHMQRGGTLSYVAFLKAMYVFGLKIPQDAACHLVGCGYDSIQNWYKMIRVGTAFAELHAARNMEFADGTVEVDATKTNVRRSLAKVNVHCGRFLIIVHRETGEYALEPLADKVVKKGAPPPPESYEEVKGPMISKIHSGHVLSSDSGGAFKKVAKLHLKSKGVPHATVLHKAKNFSHVVRIPVSKLNKRLRKRVAVLPTTTSRTYRFKAGDQLAENAFGVVKRNLKRLNLNRNTARVSVSFLSAAWLQKNCGLAGVAKALQIYQQNMIDQVHPQDAYKSTAWLSLEPM